MASCIQVISCKGTIINKQELCISNRGQKTVILVFPKLRDFHPDELHITSGNNQVREAEFTERYAP